LTAAGYRVEIATDGIAGVEAFTRLNPDMVLVEAMIPKKHGFEVCQELKRTPHGRRTPIIITTGVYKGGSTARKLCTSTVRRIHREAIAAEQLLAIVERFLSNAPTSSARAGRGHVEASEISGSASAEGARTAPESASPRSPSHKPNNGPKAVVADLTEDEIMARLDAILPVLVPRGRRPTIEIEDVPPEAPVATVATEPVVEMDPFRQMQAELSAELGTLSTALALEPEPILEPVADPIPSDQAAVPPLLESLPPSPKHRPPPPHRARS
jgi:CheY-like chemotaxis protein